MNDWFTVETIDNQTYIISEYKHWEETHCYLLCGNKKAILIDTGLGIENIKQVVNSLTTLPILVLTTHVHWDHIGGHRYFEDIGVHELEKNWISIEFPILIQEVKRNLMLKPCQFPENFDIDEYHIFQGTPQLILKGGECFELGDRKVSVIHTPGHSPGHCCFYDLERKYLYSGDLVYKGCLDAFYPTTDPSLFLQSLRKISTLEINKVLPGHHQLDIPTNFINKVKNEFIQLEKVGKLKQGAGIFEFDDFQIHL